jgi:hypothetical protein
VSLNVRESSEATHLTIRGDDDQEALSVNVIEYGHDGVPKLLVRAGMGAVISSGFDLDPQSAIQLSNALKRHALRLLQEVPA